MEQLYYTPHQNASKFTKILKLFCKYRYPFILCGNACPKDCPKKIIRLHKNTYYYTQFLGNYNKILGAVQQNIHANFMQK
ncbi:MAG: hypothetical protein HFG08_03115 [Oscillibacter sp.]|nr:hypothetical protein [Oscillibacter sp.]